MPRKRRKLNADLEKEIAAAKRKVELITAIINDIEEEDIQGEYRIAFESVRNSVLLLSNMYDLTGFNDESEMEFSRYKQLITNFELEYEI